MLLVLYTWAMLSLPLFKMPLPDGIFTHMHTHTHVRAHTHTHTPIHTHTHIHNFLVSIKFCRHRGKGKTALWNPGCDHAGIATQVSYCIAMHRR